MNLGHLVIVSFFIIQVYVSFRPHSQVTCCYKSKSQIWLCHMHTCFLANIHRGSQDRLCSLASLSAPKALAEKPGPQEHAAECWGWWSLLNSWAHQATEFPIHETDKRPDEHYPLSRTLGVELACRFMLGSYSLSMQAHSSQPPFQNHWFQQWKTISNSPYANSRIMWFRFKWRCCRLVGARATSAAVDSWPGASNCWSHIEHGFLMETLPM